MTHPGELATATHAINRTESPTGNTRGLEGLTYLLTKRALHEHSEKQSKSLDELKAGHEAVKAMHQLQKMIKVSGESDDSLAITDEIATLIEKTRKAGAEVPDFAGKKITRQERLDLYDHLRVTIDDMQTDNNMKFQTMTRVTNTLHEMYAVARKIMSTLNDIMKKMASGIAQR